MLPSVAALWLACACCHEETVRRSDNVSVGAQDRHTRTRALRRKREGSLYGEEQETKELLHTGHDACSSGCSRRLASQPRRPAVAGRDAHVPWRGGRGESQTTKEIPPTTTVKGSNDQFEKPLKATVGVPACLPACPLIARTCWPRRRRRRAPSRSTPCPCPRSTASTRGSPSSPRGRGTAPRP